MKRFNTLLKTSLMLLLIAGVILVAASCDMISGLIGGHTHSLVKVDKINATCTEAGQEAYYTCSGCDEIFSDADGENQLEAPKAIAPLGHKIIGVVGSEPTCTEAGVADSYKCSECNKLFADAKGEKEIEAADTVPALGHTLVHVEAKAVSCTENGNKEYWGCSVCSKIFADEAATTETTVADQTIISSGHSISKTEAKDATCTEDGNIAYWSCSVCNKVYADEACKSEISAADVVVSAKGHSYSEELVIEGAVTNYEPGESFNTTNLIVKLDCSACDHAVVVTEYAIDKIDNLQPEDGEIMISYQQDGKVYSASIKIVVKHEHTTGSLVTAVEPTCTEAGSVAYYECTVCKAKFEDQEATKPIENIVVAAKGHSGVKTDANASTCTSEGNNEYWTCSVCDCVFADEACTVATTVAEQTLPVAEHETEVKSDANGHWTECKNCDTYKTESESHSGIAYPDAAPVCTVCGTEFGEASWDGWVLFRPGIAEVTSGLVNSASHVNVGGIMASQYVFGANTAGAESVIWTNSEKSQYHNGKYTVRIPTVGNNERYVYLYVSNDGDTAISFRIYSENYGDKGGVDVTLGAGESGYFKYSVHTGTTIGSNVNIKLLSDLESETTVTIYGYWHIDESEIAELQIANRDQIKVSYMEGEKFDISNLILGTYIYANADGDFLSDNGAELYYIANNFKVSGLENGQVLEEGNYTVTVSFGGKSVQFTVIVSSHTHAPEYVAKKNATCTEDGHEAYYICNVNNCGQLFADAEGNTPISEITVLPAGHIDSAAIPGFKPVCPRCGLENGEVRDPDGWVHFAPGVVYNDYYEGISGTVNGADYISYEIGNYEGNILATKFTFAAGTPANASTAFWNDQDLAHNIKVPVRQGGTQTVVVITNHGTEDLIISFGQVNSANDTGSGTILVPAGKTAAVDFAITGGADLGNNGWIAVRNEVTTETSITLYGYFNIENDAEGINIIKPADKLIFSAGEMFTAEGLRLKLTNSHGSGAYYGQTEIYSNFSTDLDGYVFTAADTGTKTVTVSFGGASVTYEIEIEAHKHILELVAGKAPVACTEDGVEDYYKCTVPGCTEIFSDAEGNNKIADPIVISCHTSTPTLPGERIICAVCGVGYEVYANDSLMPFAPGKPSDNPYYEGISGTVDGRDYITKEHITLDNGMPATKFNIAAGAPENASIALWCGGNNSRIPVRNGGTRVLMSLTNNGNVDVTISIGAVDNSTDKGSGTILVPAGQTVALEFTVNGGADIGNNIWFAVRNSVEEATSITAYGYIDVTDDVDSIEISFQASKTTFAVGESFSAAGLGIRIKPDKAASGAYYGECTNYYTYTTNLDGVVFEEAGSYEVVVSFAGKTVTYQITVE